MSYDLVVYVARSNMPTPADWSAAILKAGLPASLPTSFDVALHRGFLPCPVSGEIAGFEYFASKDSGEKARRLLPNAGIDFRVLFACSGKPRELISVVSAASVLASIGKGFLEDVQINEVVQSDGVIEWAHEKVAEVASFGSFRRRPP